MPTPPTPPAGGARPVVTAVVVAHHGDRWLPGLQAALAAQTRAPDLVLGADTSGTDPTDGGSLATMRDWLGADRVAELPARTGFGAAVAAALELAPGTGDWVWLLHDDCAPDPRALAALLAEVARDPEVALAGPKVLGLGDRRLMLEVGVTISRSGAVTPASSAASTTRASTTAYAGCSASAPRGCWCGATSGTRSAGSTPRCR